MVEGKGESSGPTGRSSKASLQAGSITNTNNKSISPITTQAPNEESTSHMDESGLHKGLLHRLENRAQTIHVDGKLTKLVETRVTFNTKCTEQTTLGPQVPIGPSNPIV